MAPGRIVATRSRIEKNDPAAMNSAKHMRHRWRARRGPPRGMPKRMMRTSPAAAMTNTAAMINDITPAVRNGTPFESRPGVLINLDSAKNAADGEYDRDCQRNGVDSARPGRYRANSGESGSDEIRRQHAGEYIPVVAALEEAEN